MEEYSAGTDVTIVADHSYNGTSLTLTDLQFQVLDSLGTVLLDYATPAGFNPADTSTSITIDSTYNTSTEKVDVRQVNIRLITAGGTYTNSIFYKLLGDLTKLTVMIDSFMTFPESVITRAKMSEKLEWFDALTDPLKATALSNSFESIYKMGFKQVTTTTVDTPLYVNAYTETQFRNLPSGMQLALKRAQIAQANAMVENSPIRRKLPKLMRWWKIAP
jgi:hypothetical protein